MPDIICLGEPLFELAHCEGRTWREGIGGDVSNVAIAAARQGARAGMISRLGDDSFGAAIRAQWDADGVDHSAVITAAGAPTGLYFIRQSAQGHAFEYRRAGSAAAGMSPADLPALACRILHLSGITMAISESSAQTGIAAIARAKAAGARVSYDPNLRLNLTTLEEARAAQRAVFEAGCEIALPGLDDARQLTGRSAASEVAAWYLEAGARIVALTMGAEGALIATPEGQTLVPPRPARLVDASGAGDCFDGSFLARLCAGDSPAAAARYAVAASSLSVQGIGAVAPIPTASEVAAALSAAKP